MEVLNNIWTAISTPNEGLVNVLMTLATFVENYIIMLLFIPLFIKHANIKQKTIYVISMSLISILTNFLLVNPLNILINYISMFLLILWIFKLTIIQSFISMLFSALIFGLIGFLIINPYLTFMNITSIDLENIVFYRLLYLLIIYFIASIIIIVVKNHNFKIPLLVDMDSKTKLILLTTFIFGIITFIFQSIVTFYYIDKLHILITFFCFIILL